MKVLISALIFLTAYSANAASVCSDFNTQTRVAREAVKFLVALADVPNVVAYYGGVESTQGDVTIVNVQPHFQHTKDWYKVSVRTSDCRVTNVSLFLEKLPIN